MADPEPEPRNSMAYELGLAALAVLSVGIGVYEFVVPRAHPGFTWLDWLDLAIVAVFVVDFGVESYRHGSVWRYARSHWWEIPSLLPITGAMVAQLEGVQVVRGLRLVRIVRFVRVVRLAGVAARLRGSAGYARRIVRRARILLLLGVGIIVVALGSVAAFLLERHANENLRAYPDALWWALNLFSNVAYVDFQPATGGGRVVAAVLEFLGIAFIGVFAGSVANALLREPDERDGQASNAGRAPQR